MDPLDETPYAQSAPTRTLAELRLRAEALARDEDDEGLLALVNELRDDVQQWPHLWAPAAAIAAARSAGSSRLGGLDLLRDAVAGGFAQPELFDGLIEDHFAALPEWEGLRRLMHENVPPAPLEILEWPDPPAALPLLLDRLGGERADLLRGQLPNPSGSAWETAKALLAWVHRRWDHANDHVDDPDAVDVLTRVDAGERFACVEYSIVLSQALNALEIPARRVSLRQANHHTGMGRGHVVSEAWVDDLGRWVLLDGQNGAYWVDDDGDPLGLVDLQAAYACGDGPATFVGPAGTKSVRDALRWSSYFASASTTGYAWTSGPFSPIFQGLAVTRTGRLLRSPESAYADVDAVAVGVGGTVESPEVNFSTDHPFAVGFVVTRSDRVDEIPLDDARWQLRSAPGLHEAEVAVRTAYGVCRASRLVYRRAG